MEYTEDHFLFPLVTEPKSRWEKAGLSPRQERSFNRSSTLLVALFVTGWLYSIFLAPPEDLEAGRPPVARLSSELVRSPLDADGPTPAAFLTEGMVRAFSSDFEREAGMANQMGISGVPTFIFDSRFMISGAREPEILVKIIDRAMQAQQGAGSEAAP